VREPSRDTSVAPTLIAIFLGAILMLCIGLAWYLYAMSRVSTAGSRWWTELTRADIAESSISPRYQYLLIVAYLLPWTPFFIIGVIEILRMWKSRRPELFALALAIIPLLIMTFFRDREDRYALPVISAAAVVSATGVVALIRRHQLTTVFLIFIPTLIGQLLYFRHYADSDHGRSAMRPLAAEIVQSYPDAIAYNAHPRGKRPPTDLGVYLNRIIRRVSDPQTISPSNHPQVLFMLQDAGEPAPAPPEGFQLLRKIPRGRDWWYAFVRPANPV
jgi:hypothetical protein